MNKGEPMGFSSMRASLLLLTMSARSIAAQTQPATIPTVVAQAMFLEPEILGRPRFFSGQTPPDWPRGLVPASAQVIGGGVVGDSAMFRMRTAVFAFPAQSNPTESMRTLLAQAGFTRHNPLRPRGSGGFVESEPPGTGAQFCNASTLATFGIVDSLQNPRVMALSLLDGEAGRQNCTATRDPQMGNAFPVTVPTLRPPKGTVQYGRGSSWGGSTGEMRSTLRTTMSADSILSNYSAQLVASGWTAEGRPAVGDGAGVQPFSFRQGEEKWTAAMIVLAVGDRREIVLHLSKAD